MTTTCEEGPYTIMFTPDEVAVAAEFPLSGRLSRSGAYCHAAASPGGS